MSTFSIRTASRTELGTILGFAAAEGWNPGHHDASTFFAADPDGFLIGTLDDEPVASISAVRYGASYGFVGLYIVKPPFRGRGYGMQIWKAGMDRLNGRVVGLDGVVAQQDNYRKSGFVEAWRNVRYEGVSTGAAVHDLGIANLADFKFEEVNAYDSAFFPAGREQFLRAWIGQPGAKAAGISAGGRLAGYGVIRPCLQGYKIGPLFAGNAELAERLFSWLTAQIPGATPIFLDLPEPNQAAISLAARHQMKPVFETSRMFKGVAPDLVLGQVFGITSFELG